MIATTGRSKKKGFFLDLPVVAIKDTPTKEVNARFNEIVRQVKPNIAFIPHKGDMHIDHGEVAKAAMVALRPIENPQLKEIYVYETLSETEWNIPTVDNVFIPNCYNDISGSIALKKQCSHVLWGISTSTGPLRPLCAMRKAARMVSAKSSTRRTVKLCFVMGTVMPSMYAS